VYFTRSGTASNGTDFVQIPLTNSIVFPAGVGTNTFLITPFLDHRTEGDEAITLTLVSNVYYTFTAGTATVTIHDSPYGMWNITNFTLEELTDPSLSGESADFDHDQLVNFAEYAASFSPRIAQTNSPLQTAIEVDPGDGLPHIVLTYQRRLLPTDVGYAPAVATNLSEWLTGTNVVRELSATNDANGLTETVKAQVVAPWPASVPQFITIRVWLQSTGP
jgi:hypothetical protein